MGKFTLSDGLAATTTGISLVGSLGKGLKFDPNADKPRIYNPKTRKVTGDVNYNRYLNKLDADFDSTTRSVQRLSGSDQNSGMRGILEADRNRIIAKDGLDARHSSMAEAQERENIGIENQFGAKATDDFNNWKARQTDRDFQGSRDAQQAARESIQSGVQYASDKETYLESARNSEQMSNDFIDMSLEKYLMDAELQMSRSLGVEGAKKWRDDYAERVKPTFEKMKRYNYSDRPNIESTPTLEGAATPTVSNGIRTDDQIIDGVTNQIAGDLAKSGQEFEAGKQGFLRKYLSRAPGFGPGSPGYNPELDFELE